MFFSPGHCVSNPKPAPLHFTSVIQQYDSLMLQWMLNLLCKAGMHYGFWDYGSDAEPVNCTQTLICRRCDDQSSRVRHDHGPWVYDSEAENCAQTLICRRCGELFGSRVLHDVQHWKEDVEYWEPGWSPGKDYGVCERCKQRQTRDKPSPD